jgi:hypothetical protein
MVDDLSWEGNSKTMFDKLLESAPAFMREQAKKTFEDWVAKKGITTMTEELLEEHIKESAPAPMQAMILGQLAQFKSK